MATDGRLVEFNPAVTFRTDCVVEGKVRPELNRLAAGAAEGIPTVAAAGVL